MLSPLQILVLRRGWAAVAVVAFHFVSITIQEGQGSLNRVTHMLGGAAAAYLASGMLRYGSDWFGSPKVPARQLIVFCIATTVAVFWEFVEYVFNNGLAMNVQYGLSEAILDLVMGCFGAALYVLGSSCWTIGRRRTQPG